MTLVNRLNHRYAKPPITLIIVLYNLFDSQKSKMKTGIISKTTISCMNLVPLIKKDLNLSLK